VCVASLSLIYSRSRSLRSQVVVWDEPSKVFDDAEEELEKSLEAESTGVDTELVEMGGGGVRERVMTREEVEHNEREEDSDSDSDFGSKDGAGSGGDVNSLGFSGSDSDTDDDDFDGGGSKMLLAGLSDVESDIGESDVTITRALRVKDNGEDEVSTS